MKLRLKLLTLATGLALSAGAAHADPDLWFSDANGKLGKIDVVTGQLDTIGNMGIAMTDLAFSPTGQLYGTTFNALYSINTATAAVTLIGTHNRNVNSLVFGADGTLYAASSTLYTLNPNNGSFTTLGGIGFSSSGDLAFVGGKLYLSSTAGGDSLILVNQATGAGTLVGGIGRSSVFGLASPNGSDLYGMSGNTVFAINVATGAAGPNLQNFSGQGFGQVFGTTFFEEAAPPPIPEPSTYALMLAGLGVVGWMARRRQR